MLYITRYGDWGVCLRGCCNIGMLKVISLVVNMSSWWIGNLFFSVFKYINVDVEVTVGNDIYHNIPINIKYLDNIVAYVLLDHIKYDKFLLLFYQRTCNLIYAHLIKDWMIKHIKIVGTKIRQRKRQWEYVVLLIIDTKKYICHLNSIMISWRRSKQIEKIDNR